MDVDEEYRRAARFVEFGRALTEQTTIAGVAAQAAAVVHDLGAAGGAVSLPSGPAGELTALAHQGVLETDAQAHPASGPGHEGLVRVPVPFPDQFDGELLVQGVEGSGLLPAPVLAVIAELTGFVIEQHRRRLRDDVTGLLTRSGLEHELAQSPATAGDWQLVLCDLDDFRRVNEVLGTRWGDALLAEVGRRLRAAAPQDALVCRASADQFLVLAPQGHRPATGGPIAETLHGVFDSPIRLGDDEVYMTATFGAASGRAGGDMEGLLRAAEEAVRSQKDRRTSAPRASAESLQLDTDLHEAVGAGRIRAEFQPFYDLRSGAIAGFEALARWSRTGCDEVPPDAFIPLAEHNGLIHDLGRQMLEQVAGFMRDRPDAALAVQLNVSTTQLATPGYAADVARCFAGDEQLLHRVTVELTESALVLDHDLVRSELAALRELGVGVSLDDFGSGYSSLSRLQALPATQLKIDKAFVQSTGAVGVKVLDAIIRLGVAFGLEVVAEGVETVEQLHVLQDLGCVRAQGFLFSPAVPAESLGRVPASIAGLLHG